MAHTLHTSDTTRWLAVSRRDRTANLSFFYGAVSTRIFCRPTCPGRVARRSNVVFFDDREQAAGAGYRPCRRCQPCSETWARGDDGAALARCLGDLIAAAEAGGLRWPVKGFARGLGVSGAHLHREFKKHYGLTPRCFGASLRSGALTTRGQKEDARSADVFGREGIDGDSTPHCKDQQKSNAALGPPLFGKLGTGPFMGKELSPGFLELSGLEKFLFLDDN